MARPAPKGGAGAGAPLPPAPAESRGCGQAKLLIDRMNIASKGSFYVETLEGTWIPDENDEKLQDKFWKIFTSESKTKFSDKGLTLHGEIKARYGAKFLRENINWLN